MRRLTVFIILAIGLGAILLIGQIRRSYASGLESPPPAPNKDMADLQNADQPTRDQNDVQTQSNKHAKGHHHATAVLAGGCFWCTEAVFQHVKGVDKVVSGFAGGKKSTAHYQLVASGSTNHAESIKITYEPAKVSYGTLLRVFFGAAHDPTQVNGQGPDIGSQYRSVIFYDSPQQKQVAKAYISQLEKAGTFDKPIATKLTHLDGFYPAKAYHQDFARRHPNHVYIQAHVPGKLHKLRSFFPDLVKKHK